VKAFVVRLVVLSVMWAVCEMLLPEGKTQQAVRFTASLLVMLSLLSFMAQLMDVKTAPVSSGGIFTKAQVPPASKIYLRSRANQIRDYITALCLRAGYESHIVVYLTVDGALERVDMKLWTKEGNQPLLSGTELGKWIAEALGTKEETLKMQWEEPGSEGR